MGTSQIHKGWYVPEYVTHPYCPLAQYETQQQTHCYYLHVPHGDALLQYGHEQVGQLRGGVQVLLKLQLQCSHAACHQPCILTLRRTKEYPKLGFTL